MADTGGGGTSQAPRLLCLPQEQPLGHSCVGKALICPLPTITEGSSSPLSLVVPLLKVRALPMALSTRIKGRRGSQCPPISS